MDNDLNSIMLFVNELIENGSDIEAKETGDSIVGVLDDHIIKFEMTPICHFWSNQLVSKVRVDFYIDDRSIYGNLEFTPESEGISVLAEMNGKIMNISHRVKSKENQLKYFNEKIRDLKKS